ncbi:hypothetical protein KFZ56_10680 [Virgibacillus sp. NKC19-3]|nr:hypothetical protein [Virgibacillus sp. NKC19-3]
MLTIGIIIHVQSTFIEAGSQLPESSEASTDSDTKQLPFYWIVGIIGGCIVLTLSYVSFRKYKGEKKKQKDTDKTVD